jgi:hypothetical protein
VRHQNTKGDDKKQSAVSDQPSAKDKKAES